MFCWFVLEEVVAAWASLFYVVDNVITFSCLMAHPHRSPVTVLWCFTELCFYLSAREDLHTHGKEVRGLLVFIDRRTDTSIDGLATRLRV